MCAQRRCPAVSCPHPALDGCACGVCDGCTFYGRSCFSGEQFPNPVDRCQICSCLVPSHSCFECRLTLWWFLLNCIYSIAGQRFLHIYLLTHSDPRQIQETDIVQVVCVLDQIPHCPPDVSDYFGTHPHNRSSGVSLSSPSASGNMSCLHP